MIYDWRNYATVTLCICRLDRWLTWVQGLLHSMGSRYRRVNGKCWGRNGPAQHMHGHNVRRSIYFVSAPVLWGCYLGYTVKFQYFNENIKRQHFDDDFQRCLSTQKKSYWSTLLLRTFYCNSLRISERWRLIWLGLVMTVRINIAQILTVQINTGNPLIDRRRRRCFRMKDM